MSSFESQHADNLTHLAVLIPAWQPDARLSSLVEELTAHTFAAILVIDDGSTSSCTPIFDGLQKHSSVAVLRHAKNLGKGMALKTGFKHILQTMPTIIGVITADADGQHTADDIVRVAQASRKSGDRMVLGARTFAGTVPARCRMGNTIIRKLFQLSTGIKLTDTQTGLRGIPRSLLPEVLRLHGDRYEFEMTTLAHLCRTGRRPLEVQIQTLYLDGNASSHFNPFVDSLRILFALIRPTMRSQHHQ